MIKIWLLWLFLNNFHVTILLIIKFLLGTSVMPIRVPACVTGMPPPNMYVYMFVCYEPGPILIKNYELFPIVRLNWAMTFPHLSHGASVWVSDNKNNKTTLHYNKHSVWITWNLTTKSLKKFCIINISCRTSLLSRKDLRWRCGTAAASARFNVMMHDSAPETKV